MCHDRLAEGEAPACVAACPTEAIKIVKVNVEEKAKLGERDLGWLNGAPAASITLPTTRYTGREVPLTAHAADHENLTPEHAHWPLVLMLTFTQAAVGIFIGMHRPGLDPLNPNPTQPKPRFNPHRPSLSSPSVSSPPPSTSANPSKPGAFSSASSTSWLSRELLAFTILGGFLTAPLINHLPFALPSFLNFLPTSHQRPPL